jgi:hypothetical protein
MKYIKNEINDTQSEISDELAELWINNGNKNISDAPWQGLTIVPSYIVTDKPMEDEQ